MCERGGNHGWQCEKGGHGNHRPVCVSERGTMEGSLLERIGLGGSL